MRHEWASSQHQDVIVSSWAFHGCNNQLPPFFVKRRKRSPEDILVVILSRLFLDTIERLPYPVMFLGKMRLAWKRSLVEAQKESLARVCRNELDASDVPCSLGTLSGFFQPLSPILFMFGLM